MGIQASELRIGNWVGVKKNYKNVDQVDFVKVTGSASNGVSYDSEHIIWEADIFQPIPLTPEILEKCGFVGIGADFQIGDLKIFSGHQEFWFWHDELEVKLTSIHQLQNLYWCLVGEELKIQL